MVPPFYVSKSEGIFKNKKHWKNVVFQCFLGLGYSTIRIAHS